LVQAVSGPDGLSPAGPQSADCRPQPGGVSARAPTLARLAASRPSC